MSFVCAMGIWFLREHNLTSSIPLLIQMFLLSHKPNMLTLSKIFYYSFLFKWSASKIVVWGLQNMIMLFFCLDTHHHWNRYYLAILEIVFKWFLRKTCTFFILMWKYTSDLNIVKFSLVTWICRPWSDFDLNLIIYKNNI